MSDRSLLSRPPVRRALAALAALGFVLAATVQAAAVLGVDQGPVPARCGVAPARGGSLGSPPFT